MNRTLDTTNRCRLALSAIFTMTVFGGCGSFEREGVQVGETMPNLTVHELSGEPVELKSFWSDRPMLLVTGSITCPVAAMVPKRPSLEELAEKYEGRAHVLLLYVIEAHPKGDASPYASGEWVTIFNHVTQNYHRQPVTLEQRIRLARLLKPKLGDVRIVVDAMDNAAWQAAGRGPNMALWIHHGGRVAYKQGWFNPWAMEHRMKRDPSLHTAKTRHQ